MVLETYPTTCYGHRPFVALQTMCPTLAFTSESACSQASYQELEKTSPPKAKSQTEARGSEPVCSGGRGGRQIKSYDFRVRERELISDDLSVSQLENSTPMS